MPESIQSQGACADLAPVAIDRYFLDAHGNRQYFAARTGKAICSRCAVAQQCRIEALNRPTPPYGVVGGMSAREIAKAKTWRLYEQGGRDSVPRWPRPDWLPMTEATLLTESLRTNEELGDEGTQATANTG